MSRTVKFEPYFNEKLGRYCIYIPPWLSETGKPARLYFKDRNDAQTAANRLKTRHKTFGTSLTSLSPVRLGEAAEAYSLLDQTKRPFSLLSIIRAHIAREEQKNRSITLYDLFMQYIEAHGHHSVLHKEQILSMLKRFKPKWETAVSEIESDYLEGILEPLAGTTRNRYLRTLSAIWNYAIKKEFTKENPLAKLDRVHIDKKSTETFSNRVIAGMLNEALASKIEMVPYFALGAFAGLRVGSGELSTASLGRYSIRGENHYHPGRDRQDQTA